MFELRKVQINRAAVIALSLSLLFLSLIHI